MIYKMNQPCFCSWSGGKDSCLAFYKAIKMGYDPKFLFTTCIEDGSRSRWHSLSMEILQAQAKSLKLPLIFCKTSCDNYREAFIREITGINKNLFNITAGIFGDIDLEEHRKWVQEVCLEINCEPILPLWKCERKMVITEFLESGFKAQIVIVDSKKLGPDYLGRIIDMEILEDFANKKIDLCGENGEFHTLVIDGPIFTVPLNIKKHGKPSLHSDYWIQDFCL